MIRKGEDDEGGYCLMILRWMETMLGRKGWQKTRGA